MMSIGAVTLGAILVASSPPADRVTAWREDVAIAKDQFLSKDKSFTAEARARAAARLADLDAHVAGLTDTEVQAEFARIAAIAHNAHTRAYLLRNRGLWRRYPIRIWRFSDGWHVVAVRPGYEALLGGRLVAINGMPRAAATARVRPLFAGVDNWADYMAGYSLTSADALVVSGVVHGEGAAVFKVEGPSGTRTLSLPPGLPQSRAVPEENWWFLSPVHAAANGWAHVLRDRDLPLYLAHPNDWYSLSLCDDDLVYMQFYRAEDQAPTSLAQFGQRVLAELEKRPKARLIIDLRFNTGGNLQKAAPLIATLADSAVGQARGRLYVIVGPSTFSAAINHAAQLRQDTRAIFVGTEPGDDLIFWAEGGNVVLPHSHLILHYADGLHDYTGRSPAAGAVQPYAILNIRDLKPDRPAHLSFSEYLAGRDPFMEQIAPKGLRCQATS